MQKKHNKSRLYSLTVIMLSMALMFALFLSACNRESQEPAAPEPPPAATPAPAEDETPADDEEDYEEDYQVTGDVFPLFDTVTNFTWWIPYSGMAMQHITCLNETVFMQEMERLTNVRFEFMIPPGGQDQEQFNLIIASGNLPDLMTRAGLYRGGGDRAIQDGVFLRLNELIESYAPNYRALRESDPMIARQTVSDSQNIWAFIPIIDFEDTTWWGPMTRQDWLDEIGMDVPTTLDGWHQMLTGFRDHFGITTPLVNLNARGYDPNGGIIAGAFGIWPGFYHRDGVVRDGRLEAGFRDYLEFMAMLYAEGLIDQDFPTRGGEDSRALFTSGQAGVIFESPDTVGSITDPLDIPMIGIPYPVLNEGDELLFRMRQWNIYPGGATAITTTASHPEALVKFLDFGYGQEGRILFNFGIEGHTFVFDEHGNPQFTDYVLNNPDGIPLNAGIHIFRAHNEVPSFRFGSQSNPIPMQRPASQVVRRAWTDQSQARYNMPPIEFTAEEGTALARIESNLNPFRGEMILRFIIGEEPIENFDDFVAQAIALGADEEASIWQQAFDRFMAR